MIEQIFGAWPVDSSSCKALLDEISSFRASFAFNARESNLEIEDGLFNLTNMLLVEGLLSSKYLKSKAANSPDVDLFIVLFTPKTIHEFRSFVTSRSQLVGESFVVLD